MVRLSIVLFASVVGLYATVGQAEEKPVHLFILSGQSNMAGMNPKVGFEPEAKTLFADADVAYIKVAQGGQPIRYWVTQWNDIATKHGIDTKAKRAKDKDQGARFYDQILKQYQVLIDKHPQPASVTFCWMQGERDAKEQLSAAYADALNQLITNLRKDLQQPKMRFVIARLSDFGKADNKHWQDVRQAQVKVAESDSLGSWVDCDDLNDKENKQGVKRDDLHYTKQGYELLGRRFARQAKALIDGRQPDAKGRPE